MYPLLGMSIAISQQWSLCSFSSREHWQGHAKVTWDRPAVIMGMGLCPSLAPGQSEVNQASGAVEAIGTVTPRPESPEQKKVSPNWLGEKPIFE